MSKNTLKKGDEVVVIAGSEKTKRGKILEILPPKARRTKAGKLLPTTGAIRVKIEGVNLVKRHTKKQGKEEGGIIEKEAALDRSKVVLAATYDARKNVSETKKVK